MAVDVPGVSRRKPHRRRGSHHLSHGPRFLLFVLALYSGDQRHQAKGHRYWFTGQWHHHVRLYSGNSSAVHHGAINKRLWRRHDYFKWRRNGGWNYLHPHHPGDRHDGRQLHQLEHHHRRQGTRALGVQWERWLGRVEHRLPPGVRPSYPGDHRHHYLLIRPGHQRDLGEHVELPHGQDHCVYILIRLGGDRGAQGV